MGFTKGSFSRLVLLGVFINISYASGWGTYVCDLKEPGLRKIAEICSGSIPSLQPSPFAGLEEKLERVLDFVEEIKTAEDSWFHLTKRSGTVERDLSQHDEESDDEGQEKDQEIDRDDDDDRDDIRDSNQSRLETGDDDRNRNGEERARAEDDYSHYRKDRTYGEGRRDRTSEYDGQRRNSRTNQYDWRNKREGMSEDDKDDKQQTIEEDDRQQEKDREEIKNTTQVTEPEDPPRKPEKKDNEAGPKRGECSAIDIDSHETIGMFYMMSYQHGHCANRNPIPEHIRYCLGYCTTKTFIERESGIWSQGNDCKSCQPMSYETLRIPLACDDGFTFEKKFKNVVDCSCRRCKPV